MAIVGMAAEAEAARWSSSTNWIVSEGSLDGAISYDTSEEDGAAVDPAGVLLLQPPQQDYRPCEITVSFGGKHDIHRIYIRSTARVYEIYHASDSQNNSKEYLCTVRCGAAAPPSDTVAIESQDSNETIETPKQIVQSDSSSSSDEDGWVEVKLPDSPARDDQANILPKKVVENTSQIHYEATAEISDASPCLSLTFRLLSLQNKACTHIAEIYIYADPIESVNLDTPVSVGGNLAGTSLLAMFVPSLLQLSKSGISRMDEKCSADDSGVQKSQNGAGKSSEMSSLNTGNMNPQEAISSMADLKPQQVHKPEVVLENEQLGSSQKVIDSDHFSDSVVNENHPASSCVEKVLNELVSRVGRIEAFCSRFEENMMKPLEGIEMRLQRLEQKLYGFAVRADSSERCPCSRISAPELSLSKSYSDNKGCIHTYVERDETVFDGPASPTDKMAASVPESQMCPGLMFKAPDFSNEDAECTFSDDTSDSVVVDCHNESVSAAIHSDLVPESESRPGLAVKAPEFLNEDEEHTDSNDTLDSALKECPSGNKVSLDDALASALKALLTSTSIKSPNPSLMDMPSDFSIMKSDLPSSSVIDVSTGTEYLFNKSDMGSNGCEISNAAGNGTDFVETSSIDNEVFAPENLFIKSYLEKRGCKASDDVREGTALHTCSDLTAKVLEFTIENGDTVGVREGSALNTCSDLTAKALEFTIENGDTVGCPDASYSHGRDFFEDQGASLADCRSSSMLALFLSSKMSKPSHCSRALLYSPSEASDANKNELASFSFRVPNEGAVYTGRQNHGDDTINKVDLDLYLNSGPPKFNLEKNESYIIGPSYSPLDALIEMSTVDDSLEQRDNEMRLREWGSNMMSPEEGFSTQSCRGAGGGLKISIDDVWSDESYTEDSDSEESTLGDPCLNQLGRGCNENSTILAEDLIINKGQTFWSGESSMSSYWGPFAVNQSNGQATDNRSPFIYTVSTPNHCEITKVMGQPSPGCGHRISDVEIKLALLSACDDRETILDMTCASELNEKNVDILSGEISIAEPSYKNGCKSVEKEQHTLFSFHDIDQNSRAVDQLLLDMEDLNLPSLLGADVL